MDNKSLENEIIKIKERNKKVELDKKWETSWTRRICIMILTYIVVIIYSHLIRNNGENPYLEDKNELNLFIILLSV